MNALANAWMVFAEETVAEDARMFEVKLAFYSGALAATRASGKWPNTDNAPSLQDPLVQEIVRFFEQEVPVFRP